MRHRIVRAACHNLPMGNAGHHPIRRQAPATTADGPDPSITQWGDDIYIDEGYSILDDDAVVDFSGCYPRPSTEYLLTGDQFLDLASFQEARHADREREKRMEDRKFFAFTVRGRVFHPGGLDNPKIRGEARFELVPEPHNPVDPCAVAIDFRGRRIGYVHADYARWLHGYVRAANIHGYRCRVPGFIESSEGAWYAIRTFDIIHQMTGYSDIVQRITHVRRGMDDDIRATAGRPSYSQKAADAYWTYRNLDPDIFPDAPSPDLYRGLWHRAEILLKDDMAHDLARYRARRRADAESKKAMRQEERQARRINRDAEVIRLRESGLPISRIAKTVSLSEETVRRIVNGKTAGQAGYNHYSEQS